jgi:hypothetical protein
MSKILLLPAIILLPSLALAENTGPAGNRVSREVEAMQREGRCVDLHFMMGLAARDNSRA